MGDELNRKPPTPCRVGKRPPAAPENRPPATQVRRQDAAAVRLRAVRAVRASSRPTCGRKRARSGSCRSAAAQESSTSTRPTSRGGPSRPTTTAWAGAAARRTATGWTRASAHRSARRRPFCPSDCRRVRHACARCCVCVCVCVWGSVGPFHATPDGAAFSKARAGAVGVTQTKNKNQTTACGGAVRQPSLSL